MPLYEYYCEPCNGVLELLRPARDASKLQPCPQCDEDSKRIVSKQWSAFVFREGAARRLPDDGGYWHLGQKVAQPLTGAVQGFEAPEVRPARPSHAPPAVDDISQSEFRQEIKTDVNRESRGTFFKARLRSSTGPREEAAGERSTETAKPTRRRTKPSD